MPKIIKGFKAYNKGMICKGVKFEEGKIYETDKAVCCQTGFHLCKNPLDVLNYYDLCESEFSEAEALGKIDTHKEDSKIATTKIKIGAKLDLTAFVKASVNFLLETCKSKKTTASGDYAKMAASGYYAQMAASGDYAQLAASGNYAKLASSGNYAKLASSGYYAKLASSGNSAKLAASGNSAKLAASGNSAKLASSGYSAKLAASGDSAKLEINGQDSVGAGIGLNNIIKGKKGNWITLAEWKLDNQKNRIVPVCVKSAQIDGIKIKEDVFYKLENGEFIEIK